MKSLFAIKCSLVILTFGCLLLSRPQTLNAQFSPPPNYPGSKAISKDSSIIQGWANSCTVVRGWMDIADTAMGKVSYGSADNVPGKADNAVVSLGDAGIAVVNFAQPVYNGSGPDFAVFENSFSDTFLELAYVEVSSDSLRWVRFPAISLTQDTQQVETFGTLDCRLINNLAGTFRAGWGTPFDLDDIKDSAGIDFNNIRFVRIIDVIGSLQYPSFDIYGHKINDPYPTPFNTGGFDLDAVAVINVKLNSEISETINDIPLSVFPNPAKDFIAISSPSQITETDFCIFDLNGKSCLQGKFGNQPINISQLKAGCYFIELRSEKYIKHAIFVKE